MKSYLALLLLPCAASFGLSNEWYTETLHSNWRQTFRIDEILYQEKTYQQELVIFQNKDLGRVLVLDGVIQTTESDEYVYHEMMTHVPLIAHGNAKNVLVIGGGDGGILREVLKHKTVVSATLVEIDGAVVEFSKQYLPSLSNGAFDDPRVEVVIQDGCQFVKNSPKKFDVIICDSTDPIGPGAVLFTPEFYKDCHDLLTEGGIFVNQNGVPFMQPKELIDTYTNRKQSFSDVGFYLSVIPTYVGGFMAMGWATDNTDARSVSLTDLEERFQNIEGDLQYYTPKIHQASFVLPKFIENALN
jgi:spermidine synthase